MIYLTWLELESNRTGEHVAIIHHRLQILRSRYVKTI